METIIYQGQEVQATLVNYLSGNIPTSTVDADGDEELFRDAAGRYYLRRKLNWLTDHHDEGIADIRASGRTLVHRINLNGAILWATTRLNSETLDLRLDAASLITEGRGYQDPTPTECMRRVPVLLAPADNHEQSSSYNVYGVSPATLEAAKRYAATAGCTLEEMVTGLLERAAKLARQNDEKPVADIQSIGACQRFTFDYPATAKVCGRRRVLELDEAQVRRARELAAIFGLPLPAFLRSLAHYNDLPGQSRRAKNDLRGALTAAHLTFVCMDEAMARRLERAACARQQTVDEFVAESLGGDVDMWEECMLVHPATGELLEAEYEQLYTTIEDQLTTMPLGCEGEPPFGRPPAGMNVRLEAEATALVRRYLETTPYDYTERDIVSGSVVYALEQAFDNLPEAQEHGNVNSAVFHNGGWGYVEEEIRDAQDRRTGAAVPAAEAEEVVA